MYSHMRRGRGGLGGDALAPHAAAFRFATEHIGICARWSI